MRLLSYLIIIQTCITSAAYSQLAKNPPPKFEAKVVNVFDGDTFDVLYSDSTYRIRLCGIDAPENGQEFYEESKELLIKLSCKKNVTIENKGTDKYGRTLGVIYRTADTLNINKEMVKEGLAWNYIRYSTDEEMAKLENEAREKGLGIWSSYHYLEPWEYRKNH